ncbi:MAG: 50S ribosomal protein L4 [Anaerolineaceae bacterium]|nr:50S ribosomal protein L4 [Anaerolineaceae bacterium]MDD4043425.1 50S ribosomal protein L4 [Anaerolineaceae bacterium]
MKVDVFNLNGEKTDSIDLPEEIFAAKVNIDLMHQAYQRQMANARLGTHNTKRRGEVRGGGAKPWKQKGTGRARRGSMINAQSVGGGRIHTPKPRDYTQAMPQKMRRAALRSALTVVANDQKIVMVESMEMNTAKSSELAKALKALAGDKRALVLVADKSEQNENLIKSGRNLADAKLLQANYLNIRDLLSFEKVIIPLASLEVIKSYLG